MRILWCSCRVFMHQWFCQIHWNHWISLFLKNQKIAKNWVQRLILYKLVKHFNLPHLRHWLAYFSLLRSQFFSLRPCLGTKKTRKCFTWNILFINKMSYGSVALHANGTGEGTGNETGTMENKASWSRPDQWEHFYIVLFFPFGPCAIPIPVHCD